MRLFEIQGTEDDFYNELIDIYSLKDLVNALKNNKTHFYSYAITNVIFYGLRDKMTIPDIPEMRIGELNCYSVEAKKQGRKVIIQIYELDHITINDEQCRRIPVKYFLIVDNVLVKKHDLYVVSKAHGVASDYRVYVDGVEV